MTKYYVLEVADGDAKIKGKGVYEYTNLNEAVASFHKKLGIAMSSELYISDLVMVIDEYGNTIRAERYTAETKSEPELVEEETTEE